jgi:hypothetical protein
MPSNPAAFPTYKAEYDQRLDQPSTIPGEHYLELDTPGMSLRDYFAAKALVGFQAFVRGGWSGEMPADMARHIAVNCYAIADAMLAEREK